ncbi:MAG: right-handed parallel beta-helix repeat-containing protein, partial [Rhodothermales bacterium]|nr:right-handed parallel beta-helix repeat-containing protein [Rhodothermales bacterium]
MSTAALGQTPEGCDFTVTNTNSFGAGSLPQAIFDANGQAGRDTLCFAIPGDGPHTIRPSFAMPSVTDTLAIDGISQPGATCDAWPPQLMIEIDGSTAGGATNGLNFDPGSEGSEVRGLVINRFSRNGINSLADNQVFECNFLGTDVTGMVDLGNGGDGLQVNAASGTRIGGTEVGQRNLLSGNGDDGIELNFGSMAAIVEGNIIGLTAAGTAALKNDDDGIRVDGSGHRIGGSADGARNVISGNDGIGIRILGSDNRIEGNYVGTDVTGLLAMGNARSGIRIQNVGSNTIGGSNAGAGNVISANGDDGVRMFGSETTFTTVQWNIIGLAADGVTPLGNTSDGVDLNNQVAFNSVADNVLSSNGAWGLHIYDGASETQVYRNFIGTNPPGDERGNGFGGILVEDAGPQIIGGTYGDVGECCEGNTIAYNAGPGIGVDVTQAISHEKGL